MREALLYLLPCVYAFLACIGFSMLFNIHGAGMLICAGGGALGWLCYLLTGHLRSRAITSDQAEMTRAAKKDWIISLPTSGPVSR